MRLGKLFISAAAAFLISQSAAYAAEHRGVVLDAVTGGGYTYMNIEENGEKFWIAGPANTVAKGAEVSFSEQVWMPNFTSRALNRTFEKILFVSGVDDGTAGNETESVEAPVDEIHSSAGFAAAEETSEAEETSVDEAEAGEEEEESAPEPPPADGIYTIERLYKIADELKGQKIKVRGKVVKVSENIMGLTWVHIQDGTGTRGKNKLVFRSASDTAKLGDTVVAEGTLDTDKDFGFGYYYAVIVEDATFTE
jgi:hypothetical protein